MKIAIVGKRGSGKSTVSSLLALALAQQGKNVLAIDADYNMDMAYGLGWNEEKSKKIHDHRELFYQHLGLEIDSPGNKVFEKILAKDHGFGLFPHDQYMQSFINIHNKPNLQIAVSGGYTNDMIFGSSCSHGYYKPLKYYLGFVEKKEDDFIIIDSVAGTDMVGYGLYLGIDALIVVIEPTRQSINVYNQITTVSEQLEIPVYAIFNKINNEDINTFQTKNILGVLKADMGLLNYGYENISDDNNKTLSNIIENIRQLKQFNKEEIIERYRKYHDTLD